MERSNFIQRSVRLGFILIPAFIFINSTIVLGQQVDCSRSYYKAEDYYSRGMIDSALITLTPCLETEEYLKNEPRERRINIYRLAALSSFLTGQPENGNAYVKRMVELDPGYKDNFREGDLGEFREAVLNLQSIPFITAGLKGGMNIPMLTLEKQYSKWTDITEETKIEGKMGYGFYLTGGYAFSNRLSLLVEPGIMVSRNKYYGSLHETEQYTYDQELVIFELPILACFQIMPGSKINPYVEGGIGGRFFLSSSSSSPYGDFYATQTNNSEVVAAYISKISFMNLQLGAGATYSMKNAGIKLGIRYELNLNDSGLLGNFDDVTGFDDIPTSEEVYHVDDIVVMGLNHLRIYIGYTYTLKSKVF